MFDGGAILFGNGCDRDKSDAPSAELLLHLGAKIGYKNVALDKRVADERDTDRTANIVDVVERVKETG